VILNKVRDAFMHFRNFYCPFFLVVRFMMRRIRNLPLSSVSMALNSRSCILRPVIVGTSNHRLLPNPQTRYFASDNKKEKKSSEDGDLKSTLNDINKKYEEEKAKNESANPSSSSSNNPFAAQSPSFFGNVKDLLVDASQVVVENVRLAYQEMMGETKESSLRKTLKQADSYKAPNQRTEENKDENGDNEGAEEKVDHGPSAIVVVKEGKSAWESMKERLQDSPIIRELLKNAKKAGSVAGETNLGKSATNLGRNVKDKISDAREFWETSQNPLVYTLSGIWENVTGETEEGLATAAFRKLDQDWIKVSFFILYQDFSKMVAF
jgi:hypothetical protein